MRPSTSPNSTSCEFVSNESITSLPSNLLINSATQTSTSPIPILGKRPLGVIPVSPQQLTKKPTPPLSTPTNQKSITLLSLPDDSLLKIFLFLCGYRKSFRPPRAGLLAFITSALPLACCNRRLLRIFRCRILATVDAVSNQDFLDPLARCDDRFRARHPQHLCRVAKLASNNLKHLVLPMYDSTMEDAHWDILNTVESLCMQLNSLSFVDSPHHSRVTPLDKQIDILNRLLPRITNLQMFIVRQSHKVNLLSTPEFQPKRLALYKLDPSIHSNVIKMLSTHTNTLVDLALSFDGLEGITDFTNFCGTVMKPLSCLVNYSMHNLETLQILSHPLASPVATLQGPSISAKQSRKEFDAVSTTLKVIRSSPVTGKPLTNIIIERFCPNVAVVLDMFQPRCAYQTEVSIYLHEVLLVSPRKTNDEEQHEQLPYFLATALHSSSWMFEDLHPSYFRRIQHVKLYADDDAREGGYSWFNRMFPSPSTSSTPDMRGFRFLCENSGLHIRTIVAKIPTGSVTQANTLFRILSHGLSFAKNVESFVISADLLKYVGLDHRLLYAVIGQLPHLEEMCVDGPAFCDYDGAQLENLPVLLHALRSNCGNLQLFKMEILADVSAAPRHVLQQALSSVREFEVEMPGVITNSLVELLEVSLKGSSSTLDGRFGAHRPLLIQ